MHYREQKEDSSQDFKYSQESNNFVKETGFQLGNTLLVFFGLLLTVGGFGNLVVGFSTSAEIGNPNFRINYVTYWCFVMGGANKNWDKH